MLTALAVVAAIWLLPTVFIFAWVAADRWADRRFPPDTTWAPDTEANIVEALALVDESPMPLRESPAVRRSLDLIAANEAARFDAEAVNWSAPAEWTERWV
jgi:hypothetical protein